MRYYINDEETNMSEEEIRNLEETIKSKPDEIAQTAVKKVEPFTRIVTLLGFVVASFFLLVTLVRGSYDGAVRLLFVQLEDTTVVYIAFAVMLIITLWHLVSTVRFFRNRNKEKQN